MFLAIDGRGEIFFFGFLGGVNLYREKGVWVVLIYKMVDVRFVTC